MFQQGPFTGPDAAPEPGQDHSVELEPLGLVDRHQLQFRSCLRVGSSEQPLELSFQIIDDQVLAGFFQQVQHLSHIQQICFGDTCRSTQGQPG